MHIQNVPYMHLEIIDLTDRALKDRIFHTKNHTADTLDYFTFS